MKIIKKHYKIFHALIILLTVSINLSFFINYSSALSQLSYIRDWGGHATINGQTGADGVQVAVGENDDFYLSDTINHRVLVYNTGGDLQFIFGEEGRGDGQFKFPWGIAVSPMNQNIYVADSSNNRIQYFDQSGNFLGTFGTFGTGNGEFRAPRGIAIEQNGDVYVTDYLNHRVQVFTSDGQFKIAFGTVGSANGQFRYPTDVTIGTDKRIYVVDSENHRVQVFKSDGSFVRKFGTVGTGTNPSPDKFYYPRGIATSSFDYVYIVDSGNSRITRAKTDSSGTIETNFGSIGMNSVTFKNVQDVAVAPNGYVYLVDSFYHNVYVFTNNGESVSIFEYDVLNTDGKFNNLSDVFYSKEKNQVYVTDTYNHRVQVFTPEGQFLFKFGREGTDIGEMLLPTGVAVDTNGKIFVTNKQSALVEAFDEQGNFLYFFKQPSTSSYPTFITPTGIAISNDNKVYIADTGIDRILIYDLLGNFVDEFGTFGELEGEFIGPEDVAVDNAGNIYVADTGNSRIQIFDQNKQFLRSFGANGNDNGELNMPRGIAVGSNGNIFVSDTDNYRLQVFSNTGNYISKYEGDVSTAGKYRTSIGISNGPDDSIFVADINSNRVFQFGKPAQSNTGGGNGNGSGGGGGNTSGQINNIIPPSQNQSQNQNSGNNEIPPIISSNENQNQNNSENPQSVIPPTTSIIPEPIRQTYNNVKNTFNNVITEPLAVAVNDLAEATPEPLRVYAPKTVMTSGLLFGSIAMITDNLFATPLTFPQILLFPARLWANLLTMLGIKRRRRPWGAVYDTLTKIPIDPVVMELVNKDGYVVAQTKTDIYGRYYFNPKPGHYMLRPKKEGYIFPSLILAHMTRDEVYKDIYFGNYFEIKYSNELISKNIPMDRTKITDEELKNENQKILNWFVRRDHLIGSITNLLFVVGFAVSFIALLIAPRPYNVMIFLLYLFMYLLRRAGANPSKLGKVTEKNTRKPLAFAIVRVYSVALGNEVVRRVTNKFGQFFCSVPDGKYYVSFDRKNENGSYTEALKKEFVEVKNGTISGRWEAVF